MARRRPLRAKAASYCEPKLAALTDFNEAKAQPQQRLNRLRVLVKAGGQACVCYMYANLIG